MYVRTGHPSHSREAYVMKLPRMENGITPGSERQVPHSGIHRVEIIIAFDENGLSSLKIQTCI